MSVEGQTATYDGVPCEIKETESHRSQTMHYIETEDGSSGWVFQSEIEGVESDD